MKYSISIALLIVVLTNSFAMIQTLEQPAATRPTTKPSSMGVTPQEEIKALKALVAKQGREIIRLKARLKRYEQPSSKPTSQPSLSTLEKTKLKQDLKNSIKDKKAWMKKLKKAKQHLKKINKALVSKKPPRRLLRGRLHFVLKKDQEKAVFKQNKVILLAEQSLVSINLRIQEQKKKLGLSQ